MHIEKSGHGNAITVNISTPYSRYYLKQTNQCSISNDTKDLPSKIIIIGIFYSLLAEVCSEALVRKLEFRMKERGRKGNEFNSKFYENKFIKLNIFTLADEGKIRS